MTPTHSNVRFAAIDPYVDNRIVSPKETPSRGGDYITWGDGNAFPDYLLDLFNRCATLRSIILGCTDFAAGNDATLLRRLPGLDQDVVNRQGLTAWDMVRQLALSYYQYGGFAIQVIRALGGDVAELYPLDLRYLRTNGEAEVFYYSENWRKKADVSEYPAFMADGRSATSIIYVRNTYTQVYPAPLYGASLKACETEAAIDTFHLNNISNNFVSSLFVNFNNGNPTDEVKDEIERTFCQKFAGAENGGRIGFSWNDNKDSATTFETFSVEDFGARYEALAKHCRQQIFTSFRAIPALFGINPENTGFSRTEYAEAFSLFNRTMIAPAQAAIIGAIEKALGEGAIEITPFSLGEEDTTATLAVQLGVGGTQALMSVIESTTLSQSQKAGTLKVLFDLNDEQVAQMLGIPQPENVE